MTAYDTTEADVNAFADGIERVLRGQPAALLHR